MHHTYRDSDKNMEKHNIYNCDMWLVTVSKNLNYPNLGIHPTFMQKLFLLPILDWTILSR